MRHTTHTVEECKNYHYNLNDIAFHDFTGTVLQVVAIVSDEIVECRLPDLRCIRFWTNELIPENWFNQ